MLSPFCFKPLFLCNVHFLVYLKYCLRYHRSLFLLFKLLKRLLVFLGTYSNGSQQYCIVCPPSKYCPSIDKDDVYDCQPGYFSTGGQASCEACPSGFECPNKDGTGNVKCLPVSVK